MYFKNCFTVCSVYLSLMLTVSISWANETKELHLVTYRPNPSFISQKNFFSGVQLQHLLMTETYENQNQVFGTLRNDLETLWIANSTLALLTKSESERLRVFDNVARIERLRTHFILSSVDTTSTAASKYTYGLTKIHLPEVHTRYVGLDGRGVRVGIIDTGISLGHPDLKGKTVAQRDFTETPSSSTFSGASAIDDHGHGSHVAGTIVGGDASGTLIGIAPRAELIIAKAFNSRGYSEEQWLIKALQWMADPDDNPQTMDAPRVINNSWNNDGPFNDKDPKNEPFCIAVDNLVGMGVLVVFAAGNDGPGASTIKLPASCPQAFSVGATNAKDQVIQLSSRGPVKWKTTTLIKPEVSAPGEDINSANLDDGYRVRTGTSMAAPHAVGALALLFQLKPELSPFEAGEQLTRGSQDLGPRGIDTGYGMGRIDIFKTLGIVN